MWRAEEGGEAEQIGEDAGRRYFRTGAWTSDDHRLGVVTRGLKTHDVVAAVQACERMIERISAHPGRHTSVTIDRRRRIATPDLARGLSSTIGDCVIVFAECVEILLDAAERRSSGTILST